jgi:uncharacterized protein YcnI
MFRLRTVASATLLCGAALAGALAVATPAAAHVTVNPREATQGGYTRVAFRAPTESDTASTTKLEVFLPEATPIASVSTMPVPGWTIAVERTKPASPVAGEGGQPAEVVSKITWTASAGAAVKPGEFQEFPVSLGPLPEVDQLVFKALQTYSDGSVVRWIEEPAEGGEEPEHPAPVLRLLPAEDEGSDGAAAGAADGSADDGSDGSGPALPLAIAGLVAGLLGAALGGWALVRSRRAG